MVQRQDGIGGAGKHRTFTLRMRDGQDKVKITYHRDVKEVQSDAALAHLLSDACQRAPFDRLAWWEGLARDCGMEPVIAVAQDGDAAAVLALREDGVGALAALSNWYTFRFRPIVSDERLLTPLARDLARRARRVTLAGVPDEDGSATALEQAFRAAGWVVRREPCDLNHYLAVGGRDYESYLASRPGKLRTTLKRKSGKVETQVLTAFDESAWAAYESIYAESWKPEEGSPAFLRVFAQGEGAAGRLRLGVASAQGEAIAAQMWTVEGGCAFIHKLAYREAAKPLSPGSVLTAALMRHVIDLDHVAEIDFGTGDDPYKRDWMESERPRFRLTMLRPWHPANWAELAKIAVKARLAASANRR